MPTTPDSLEIVQLEKQESAGLGGDAADEAPYAAPINPTEDMIEVAGITLVEAGDTRPIKTRAIWPDGDDLRFRDPNNPGTAGEGYTLSEVLAGAGGLTESGHRILRQLIHFIDDGPAEGFATGAYREILPAADPFPTSAIWWESSGKTKKIVELTVSYTGAFPTTEEWKMYDTDGSTVLATVTDTITYSGPFETSRTRAIVIS
jgi:hypothetical protein